MNFTTMNPATDQKISQYASFSDDLVQSIIADTHTAQQSWAQTTFGERSRLMENAAALLKRDKERLAGLMTREMGKPIRESRSEIEKCAWVCDYYATHAEKFLEPSYVKTDARKSYVAYQPLGTVLAIMPWNFPFWQVFRFAAPNLMAGNAALLKHAPNVFGCALAIENLLHQAGFPAPLFRSLIIDVEQVQGIIEHPLVRGVTLTGSVRAGSAVGASAGKALKKTVLELGGSDPFIVLPDADIAAAVENGVTSRMLNNGQSCIAAKRFIVVADVYDAFLKQFVEKLKGYAMGDPVLDNTMLGPMARTDLRDTLHEQVRKSVDRGAELILGGRTPNRPGAFYPATVLTGVRKGMPAFDEELFGPVAAIIRAESESDAIRMANDTVFGLGATLFTGDLEKGETIAATQLMAGSCFVNSFVRSDPRLPFGGIRDSGIGRELGVPGIREFVNIKTVYVQ